jgi:sulfite reductase alpha subunit-like flavoprotein
MKENILIFGNRNRSKDYLFEREWDAYQSSTGLSVFTAFSRDGPADEKKTYVQDIVSRESKIVYDYLINRNGALFISGSSGRMPQGIKDAFVEIVQTEQGVTREEAQKIHASLEKKGRWKQETW